jgi:immunity protein, SdpI family
MNATRYIPLILIVVSIFIGIALYPYAPDQMPSHWNAQGDVDDYMSKFWGLFLMPLVLIGAYLLFLILPRIDPKKMNIDSFRSTFDGFIAVFSGFMFYIYLLTLAFSFGFISNMTQMLIPAFAFLFYYVGVLLGKAKQNWMIGIRTPWTLSNEVVWNRTHRLGGKMFRIVGLVTLGGLIIPKIAFWLMIVPVIGVSVYLIIYSYLEYRKISKA